LAPSSGWRMSAFPPLSGGKQTCGERAEIDARDPQRSSRSVAARFDRSIFRLILAAA
jgi:hypothetical protein